MGRCKTIAEAIDGIRSIEELNGFIDALKDPTLKTKPVTQEEWEQIARKKIRLDPNAKTAVDRKTNERQKRR